MWVHDWAEKLWHYAYYKAYPAKPVGHQYHSISYSLVEEMSIEEAKRRFPVNGVSARKYRVGTAPMAPRSAELYNPDGNTWS